MTRNRNRRKIGRRPETGRDAAEEPMPGGDQNGLQNDFASPPMTGQLVDVSAGHRRSVHTQLDREAEQFDFGRGQATVPVVAQELLKLGLRLANQAQYLVVR